jgi:hypothetical protein
MSCIYGRRFMSGIPWGNADFPSLGCGPMQNLAKHGLKIRLGQPAIGPEFVR